jgi:hypothetical protein
LLEESMNSIGHKNNPKKKSEKGPEKNKKGEMKLSN